MRHALKTVCAVAFAAIALSAEARVLPETVVVVQTQFYPLREQARGYLGRYANQPLLVDPGLPPDPVPSDRYDIFPGWGKFHSQADFDATLREVKEYGLDGVGLFAMRPQGFFDAMARTPVQGVMTLPIMCYWDANVSNEFKCIDRILANPHPCLVDGKYLVPSYWTTMGGNTPQILKSKFDAIRAKYGDRFVFMCQVREISEAIDDYGMAGGVLPERKRRWMEEMVRDWARVSDGIHLGDIGALGRGEAQERVFGRDFVRLLHQVVKGVLDEPEFRGKKLFGTGAVVAHMNAYTTGHDIGEDCTLTLRDSLGIALESDPDLILLPEWDEYNENTCFSPTLYGGFTVKRIVRSMLAKFRKRPPEIIPGDDVSVPNLVVSYRKQLSPGERLLVEVLNVPDGSRHGEVSVAVALADENGRELKSFPAQTLRESEMSEARFIADTAELAPEARAIRVKLRVASGNGPDMEIADGLHHVDLAPANAWNHLAVRQPLRELVKPVRADVAMSNGVVSASLACDEPIRYAMLCGNGCIQAIRGKPGADADRFREDDSHAVFQIDVFRHGFVRAKGRELLLSVRGTDDVEWFFNGKAERGTSFALPCLWNGGAPCLYLRIPKSGLAVASLSVDFKDGLSGTIPLEKAYRLDAYSIGDVGQSAQLTVARFRLQGRYPPVMDAKECEFSLKADADRSSMVYHVQLVTMGGKRWFSKPFVVENGPAARVPVRVHSAVTESKKTISLPRARVPRMEYDFSPDAGNVVRVAGGERHWFGMLGAPHPSATLWNRGTGLVGSIPRHKDIEKWVFRKGGDPRPRHVHEPDGTWSLEFDGVDDFVSLPWETIPTFSGARLSFEVWPYDANTNACLFSSRTTLRTMNGDFGMQPGRWNRVTLRSRELPAEYPGTYTSCLTIGVDPYKRKHSDFFKGKIRNLVIEHATEE